MLVRIVSTNLLNLLSNWQRVYNSPDNLMIIGKTQHRQAALVFRKTQILRNRDPSRRQRGEWQAISTRDPGEQRYLFGRL